MSSLCLRCGRHETAGSYCSFCRTAEYDLVDHVDVKGSCPLGAFRDPISADKADIRRYLAKPFAASSEFPTRHHPRTPGYTVDSDPQLPAWISGRNSVRPARPGRSSKQASTPLHAQPVSGALSSASSTSISRDALLGAERPA